MAARGERRLKRRRSFADAPPIFNRGMVPNINPNARGRKHPLQRLAHRNVRQ
jgi:hypothetical protein